MRAGGATAVLLALCACAEESPAWMEVGTGELHFAPIADGADVTLAPGPQGGWHLWLAVRAGGMGPGRAEIRVRSEPYGWDGPRQERWWWIELAPVEGEPFCESVGVVAVLSPAECLRDRPLSLAVTLTDEDANASVSDSVVVIPRAPASPEMPPCTE